MNVVKIDAKPNESVITLLKEWLEQAERGEITRIGIIAERPGGEWQSAFSASADKRIDSAMLLELALRRLGFFVER
jgi:hypothetical protein